MSGDAEKMKIGDQLEIPVLPRLSWLGRLLVRIGLKPAPALEMRKFVVTSTATERRPDAYVSTPPHILAEHDSWLAEDTEVRWPRAWGWLLALAPTVVIVVAIVAYVGSRH